MIPVLALVGRPNVGKSTLFNRLTRSRDALVADYAGLTRDRKYGEAFFNERKFIVIDTGGLTGEEQGIETVMAEQALMAIEEADAVLFMVDCRAGLTPVDAEIAQKLRSYNKTLFVVANKMDGLSHDVVIAPFYELGLGEVHGIAAAHGRGVNHLMQEVVDSFPAEPLETDENDTAKGVKIAVVGRPNVGKSTLVNRLLGEERVVVFDMPGTTRDSIYINYERQGQTYTLIDTAGIRRRKNIQLTVEKFSIIKTLQAIEDANVVVLVMDAHEGLVDQDMHLMRQVIDSGRALVVALNKWDGLDEDHKTGVKAELERRLRFVEFADLHFISALHGTGVGHLYASIERSYKAATERFSTSFLTRVLIQAQAEHQPPLINGRRIKLRMAHTGGHNPPIIVIHGNQTEALPNAYVRYLENHFRKALDLIGTPIKFEFKTNHNPFAKPKPRVLAASPKKGPAAAKAKASKPAAAAKLAAAKGKGPLKGTGAGKGTPPKPNRRG